MAGATEIQSSVLYFSTEFGKLEAAEQKCQVPSKVKWERRHQRTSYTTNITELSFQRPKGEDWVLLSGIKMEMCWRWWAGDIRCAASTFQTESIVAHSHRSIQRASELDMTGIILETDGIGRRPKLKGDWLKSHRLFSASD
jgi:hypothetical protein